MTYDNFPANISNHPVWQRYAVDTGKRQCSKVLDDVNEETSVRVFIDGIYPEVKVMRHLSEI